MELIDILTWTAVILACIFLSAGLFVLGIIFMKYYYFRSFGDQTLDTLRWQEEDLEKSCPVAYTKISTDNKDDDLNNSRDIAIHDLREEVRKHTVSRRSHSMLEIPQRSRKNTCYAPVEIPLLSRKDVGEMIESQYFDAHENLDESSSENESEDAYQDIQEQRFNERDEIKRSKTNKVRKTGKPYSKSVVRRVQALKNLIIEQKKLEANFYRDILLLEGSFDETRNIVYEQRRNILKTESSDGVPGFWLQVLLNSKNIRQIIQATDIPALQSLQDVSIENLIGQLGFRIMFTFKENEFFKNLVLTKEYYYTMNPSSKLLDIQGPGLSHCIGTKVQWYRHKNLTIRPVKKVRNHKIITKFARKNSFFNFMNPPQLPDDRQDPEYQNKKDLLEAHFQIGLFFKEHLIPKACLFYAIPFYDKSLHKKMRPGQNKSSTPRFGEVDSWKLTTNKVDTPSARKINNVSLDTTLESDHFETFTIQEADNTKRKQDGTNKEVECKTYSETKPSIKMKENGNGHISSVQLMPESCADVVEDPMIGRFRMESSQMFDEYMKALGVGMIKRKLAGSVIPVNVIEIKEDNQFKISTLTSVRNSEMSFKLDEPFIEETLDGRKTETIATRKGNLLTLQQKSSSGEKDSIMTREVNGDIMTMKLIVDDITCTRIYKRVLEEDLS